LEDTSKTLRVASLFGMVALLSACGGGGDSGTTPSPAPAPATNAEGAYSGTLTGSTATAFELLVLEDGSYWAIAGNVVNEVFEVTGFVQGQGSSSSGSFTSSNATAFPASPPLTGSITATYVAGSSIAGTISLAGQSGITFNGTPFPAPGYNYDKPAAVSDVSGAWSMNGLDGLGGVALNIGPTGDFSAMAGGCSITGTLLPRLTGKNVFNVSLTFGPAPCALPDTTETGIAVDIPLQAGFDELIVVGVNSARTEGTALYGIR